MEARVAEMTKTAIFTRRTRIPESFAASSFEPTK
jgi:hypothetical protein